MLPSSVAEQMAWNNPDIHSCIAYINYLIYSAIKKNILAILCYVPNSTF